MAITKPAGTWAYEDLFSLPHDGNRYEIIEGELYEMPAPTWEHIVVVMNLVLLLGPVVRALGGQIVTAPADVFFFGADPVRPDILATLPGSRAVGGGRGIQRPPDLVIEVLSPSNRGHDVLTKRALCPRRGAGTLDRRSDRADSGRAGARSRRVAHGPNGGRRRHRRLAAARWRRLPADRCLRQSRVLRCDPRSGTLAT